MLSNDEIKMLAESMVLENTDEKEVSAFAPKVDEYMAGYSDTISVTVSGGNWNYDVTVNPETDMVTRIRRNDDTLIFSY